MAKPKGGLGRGLDSILGSTSGETKQAKAAKAIQEPTTGAGATERASAPKPGAEATEKKLPVKQNKPIDASDDEFTISEDNTTIKGVTQREAPKKPVDTVSGSASSPNTPQAPAAGTAAPVAPPAGTSAGAPAGNPAGTPVAVEEPRATDEIPVDMIVPNPDQPRVNFKKEELEELSDSIKESGLLQPIVVRKRGDRYQIIAGERRWQASKKAGLKKVPVRVIVADDHEARLLALVENVQRQDLNPVEEAYAYRDIMTSGNLTQTQVAQKVGKGRSTVANALRLLELPEEAQEMLFDEVITAGHARAILSIPDAEGRDRLTKKLRNSKISVREAEAMARLFSGKAEPKEEKKKPQPKSYKTVARTLKEALGTEVRIKGSGGKNKIEIDFKDEADLERIYVRILGE